MQKTTESEIGSATELSGSAPAPAAATTRQEKKLEQALAKTDLSGNPSRPLRRGLLLLLLGLGGFLLWAAMAPMDEGVPAPGTIVIESQRKPIQHLSGGIVSSVHVHEAQRVKQGDVLLEIDDTTLQAELSGVRAQYYQALALSARLRAERDRLPDIVFPQELKDAAQQDSEAQQHMDLQRRLRASRSAALQSELRSIDEGIASLNSQRNGLQARLKGRLAQQKLLQEQLQGSKDLTQEGYLPRNRLLQEQREAADIASQIADLEASIAANQSSVAELRFRRKAREQDDLQRIDAQLAEVGRELPVLLERLNALKTHLGRARILSPVDGNVVGLQVQSVGAVIAPGAKIMDIVPDNEKLVLDVHIQPHLVDRVHPGMLADVRFHAFQDMPQYTVQGRLISISADRLTDPMTAMPYFLGRLELLPETMSHLKTKELVPGMSAEAVIKTGERSLLEYLVQPLMRRMFTAMTEH